MSKWVDFKAIKRYHRQCAKVAKADAELQRQRELDSLRLKIKHLEAKLAKVKE